MTMSYKAPKGIIQHEAVQECECGDEAGSDYKHDVYLKEGWVFERGRMAGIRSGFFHTVADFNFANPIKLLRDRT
jgi:hypothetical protein